MTAPYWSDDQVTLYLGDCLKVLAGMESASIDAVVTDPPAAVSFMGREWDSDMGGRAQWVEWLSVRMAEAVRVLKPGGHMLVWSLPRTSHWTAWALEDAGLQIRDCIPHLFGSGFPKNHSISVAIDKAAGAEREVVGEGPFAGRRPHADHERQGLTFADDAYIRPAGHELTAPATEDAARWEGWGTALKPGQELWWLARKPISGTIAANVLEHGTGALNIAGCRIGGGQDYRDKCASVVGLGSNRNGDAYGEWTGERADSAHDAGRWPPNLVLTHSASCGDPGPCATDCPVAELDRQSGSVASSGTYAKGSRHVGAKSGAASIPLDGLTAPQYADHGGASRFYPTFRYQAKAPSSERPRGEDGGAHPTVKPVSLLSFFCRLITPPGGTVLDPFGGSGSTAEAAIIEGFQCVLIEKDAVYADLIKVRLRKDIQPVLFGESA